MESPKRAYAPDVRVARTIAYSHVACQQKLYGNARDTRAAALSQLVRSSGRGRTLQQWSAHHLLRESMALACVCQVAYPQRYNQHQLDGIKLDFVEEVDLRRVE